MGFDLYWAEPKTENVEPGESPAYFRLTNSGMVKTMTLMILLRMVETDKLEVRLPRPADFGLNGSPDDYDEHDVAFELATSENRYLHSLRVVRGGDGGGLIPSYKFGSNEGWLVTPEEIERSLARYDRVHPDIANQPRTLPVPVRFTDNGDVEVEEADWWGEWIDWLREASSHGGFRVF